MSLTTLLPLLAALPVGAPVPDFAAPNQDGKVITLSALKGKPVLVYFYPKDDTPGCTKEACALRDRFAKFQAAGIVILGVSRQDAKSHQAFRAKYHLPFDLLTDEKGEVAKRLGVETYAIIGVHKRQSLLVGADGTLLEFFGAVDPETHADEVLEKLASSEK
jgi:thioredoxin-dependent peroxiredoxin